MKRIQEQAGAALSSVGDCDINGVVTPHSLGRRLDALEYFVRATSRCVLRMDLGEVGQAK